MEHAPVRKPFARAFHTLFALGVAGAAVIAMALGRESAAFAYHGTIGLALAFLVLLRVLVGAAGVFSVPATIRRACNERSPCAARAARCATSAMLALVLALAATGQMMTRGVPGLGQLHAVAAYALLLAVIAHLLAVAFRVARRGRRTAPVGQGGRTTDAIPILRADLPD